MANVRSPVVVQLPCRTIIYVNDPEQLDKVLVTAIKPDGPCFPAQGSQTRHGCPAYAAQGRARRHDDGRRLWRERADEKDAVKFEEKKGGLQQEQRQVLQAARVELEVLDQQVKNLEDETNPRKIEEMLRLMVDMLNSGISETKMHVTTLVNDSVQELKGLLGTDGSSWPCSTAHAEHEKHQRDTGEREGREAGTADVKVDVEARTGDKNFEVGTDPDEAGGCAEQPPFLDKDFKLQMLHQMRRLGASFSTSFSFCPAKCTEHQQ
eukprot:TRINITY_DN24918_c1_g1_i1.p1 TRINITY_DN24918_c1_g1~~TRINITY_DN24918_c1_g1_i1.p1  ORF type:complete len:265 (+),score=52.48 TRINITY_DN24918_c1_g1_i1:73-867(+)